MRPDGNIHLYALNQDALTAMSKDMLTAEHMALLVEDDSADAYERKVLRDFFEGERLKEIPASRKKREVVLRWLASRFERGVKYTEREVNELIQRHHPDSATLRRELIGHRLLARETGIYCQR